MELVLTGTERYRGLPITMPGVMVEEVTLPMFKIMPGDALSYRPYTGKPHTPQHYKEIYLPFLALLCRFSMTRCCFSTSHLYIRLFSVAVFLIPEPLEATTPFAAGRTTGDFFFTTFTFFTL